MWLKKLRIDNFCGLEHFETTFDLGLNLLLGPNGSGKTSVLEAINTSLYSSSIYSRDRYIYKGKDKATVYMEFNHNGKAYTLTRETNYSASVVVLNDGTQEIVGATKVATEINRLLGGGASRKYNMFYVPQTKTTQLVETLSSTSGGKLLYTLIEFLFDVSNLSGLEVTVNKELNGRFPDVSQHDWIMLHSTCVSLEKSLKELDELITNNASLRQMRDTILQQKNQLEAAVSEGKQFLHLPQLQEQLERYRQEYNDLKDNRLPALRQKKKRTQDSMQLLLNDISETLKTDLPEPLTTLETARNFLNGYILSEETNARWEAEYEKRRAKLAEQFRGRPVTIKRTYNKIVSQLTNLQEQEKNYMTFLKSNKDKCSACFQPLTDAAREHVEHEHARRQQEIKNLQDAKEQLEEQVNTRRTAVRTINKLIDDVRRAKHAIVNIPIPSEISKKYIERIDSVTQVLQEINEHEKFFVNQLTTLETNIKDFEKMIAPLLRSAREVTAQELDRMKRGIEECNVLLEKYNKQVADYEVALEKRKQLQGQYKEAKEKLEKDRDILYKMDYCVKFVRAFRSSAIFVTREYLNNVIVAIVNGLLDHLDAPFRLKVKGTNGEELSFNAEFSNGLLLPLDRLSQGQRIIIALLLLFVFFLQNNKRGVLLLDEPLAGLDVNNISGIQQMLLQIHGMCESRNLQVILATHEDIPYGNRIFLGDLS